MYYIRKSERLNNFRLIKHLFEQGNTFSIYPFKIFWSILPANYFLKKHFTGANPTMSDDENVDDKPGKYFSDKTKRFMCENQEFMYPAKVVFSVSAKRFKNATDRNYIKRLVKESYRKNKNLIYSFLEQKDMNCLIAFVYIGDKRTSQTQIDEKIFVSLQYLISEIESNIN